MHIIEQVTQNLTSKVLLVLPQQPQLYLVEHNGQGEYFAESLVACYKWIALKLDIPIQSITHIQAIEAGYRIKVM